MPRLPQIVADRVPQGGELSISSAELPGEALAGFGRDVGAIGAQMAEKQIQLQRLNDFTAHSTDASMAIDSAVQTELDSPDFRTAPDRINTAIQKITGQTLQDVKDPQVKAELQAQLGKQRDTEVIEARAFSRKKEIDYGQSMFDASLDRNRTKLATSSGPEHDAMLSQVQGLSDAAVSAGLFSREQMRQRMDNFYKGVTEDKARLDGIVDPAGTAIELVGGHAYDSLNFTDRLQLAQQFIAQSDKRDAEREKQLKDAQETDLTGLTAGILNGTASYKEINDVNAKWTRIGIPIPMHSLDFLWEKAGKPKDEGPSDPAALDLVTHLSHTTPAGITDDQLWELHQKGKLNLKDYEEAAQRITGTDRYLQTRTDSLEIARTSLVEQELSRRFGSNPPVMAQVLGDIQKTKRFGGSTDPVSLVPQLERQYGPLMERLGGKSESAVQTEFISARNSYQSALDAKRVWDQNLTNKYIKPIVGITNPKDQLLNDRRDNLLTSARAANRDLGPAPEGSVEGAISTTKHPQVSEDGRKIPIGTEIMIIGDRVIAR